MHQGQGQVTPHSSEEGASPCLSGSAFRGRRDMATQSGRPVSSCHRRSGRPETVLGAGRLEGEAPKKFPGCLWTQSACSHQISIFKASYSGSLSWVRKFIFLGGQDLGPGEEFLYVYMYLFILMTLYFQYNLSWFPVYSTVVSNHLFYRSLKVGRVFTAYSLNKRESSLLGQVPRAGPGDPSFLLEPRPWS